MLLDRKNCTKESSPVIVSMPYWSPVPKMLMSRALLSCFAPPGLRTPATLTEGLSAIGVTSVRNCDDLIVSAYPAYPIVFLNSAMAVPVIRTRLPFTSLIISRRAG